MPKKYKFKVGDIIVMKRGINIANYRIIGKEVIIRRLEGTYSYETNNKRAYKESEIELYQREIKQYGITKFCLEIEGPSITTVPNLPSPGGMGPLKFEGIEK